jgi:hypothetical protein
MIALDQLVHLLEAEHLEQGVVERAQVGVDLLARSPGRKPSARRPPPPGAPAAGGAPLVLQRLDGAGDGEVGLAGAGRADAEVDVAVLDAAHVALLVGAAGLDQSRARA